MSDKSRANHILKAGAQPAAAPAPVCVAVTIGECLHCLRLLETSRYMGSELVEEYCELRHRGASHADIIQGMEMYLSLLKSVGERWHYLNELYLATFETSEGVCGTMPPPETWPLIEAWGGLVEKWQAEAVAEAHAARSAVQATDL